MLTSYLLGAAVALATGTVALESTQSTAPTPTASGTTSSNGTKTIEISVGATLHKFDPDSVKANVGDVIRFNFYPGGHAVARAEFEYPCIPYEYTGGNKKGFWSGFMAPQVIQNPAPHYDVKVNDTNPIFFYCGAPGSCLDYSMIGVINPTENMTLAMQKQYADNATLQLVPGDPWPSETPKPTVSSPGTSETGQVSGANGSSTPSGGSGLSTGAIAGIAIGAAAVIILGAALVYLCGRRGGFDKAYRKSVQNAGGLHGLPSPGMVESKYDNPKSPGQATMSTFSAMPHDHNPYRVSAQSPHAMTFSGTPPPPSPGFPNGYGTYQNTAAPGPHQPLIGEVPAHAYHHGQSSPVPSHQQQFQAPVELPSSDHPIPVQSPPPQYQGDRHESWVSNSERPSKP